jgi:hypothetical protein
MPDHASASPVPLRPRLLVHSALNYVEAFALDRDTLLGISIHFEETHMRIRSYIGLLALARAILIIAKEEMVQRKAMGITGRSPYLTQFFSTLADDAAKEAGVGKYQSKTPSLLESAPRRPAEAKRHKEACEETGTPTCSQPPKVFGSGCANGAANGAVNGEANGAVNGADDGAGSGAGGAERDSFKKRQKPKRQRASLGSQPPKDDLPLSQVVKRALPPEEAGSGAEGGAERGQVALLFRAIGELHAEMREQRAAIRQQSATLDALLVRSGGEGALGSSTMATSSAAEAPAVALAAAVPANDEGLDA